MSKKVKYNRNEIDKVSQLIVDKIKTIKTIILRGELGSGKTTLVKSVLKKMGVNESVTSPTFSIVNEYNFAGKIVYHFDLYRIENIEEILSFKPGLLEISSKFEYLKIAKATWALWSIVKLP